MPLNRIFCLIFVVTILSSCNAPETSKLAKQPLMVNLTTVARVLGRDEVINKKLKKADESLNAQLQQIEVSLEKKLDAKKSEIEKKSKTRKRSEREKSKQELRKLTLRAQLQFKQAQQLAAQKAKQYSAKLLNEFRMEVVKAARKIAEKRGATTVLVANPEYLWYSSKIDITDNVISALSAHPDNNKEKIPAKIIKK